MRKRALLLAICILFSVLPFGTAEEIGETGLVIEIEEPVVAEKTESAVPELEAEALPLPNDGELAPQDAATPSDRLVFSALGRIAPSVASET